MAARERRSPRLVRRNQHALRGLVVDVVAPLGETGRHRMPDANRRMAGIIDRARLGRYRARPEVRGARYGTVLWRNISTRARGNTERGTPTRSRSVASTSTCDDEVGEHDVRSRNATSRATR